MRVILGLFLLSMRGFRGRDCVELLDGGGREIGRMLSLAVWTR